MTYIHEVWLTGNTEPQRFRLETDELFQAFQRWVQQDAKFRDRGLVFSFQEKNVAKKVALNFAGVTCIILEKIDEEYRRSSLGFNIPGAADSPVLPG